MNRLSIAILLGCFVLVPVRSVVVAQNAPVLGNLPQATTLLVRVRSASELTEKWKNSPFYRLRENPEIDQFLQKMKKTLDEAVGDIKSNLGFDPRELLEKVQGEVVVAVGGLDKLITAIANEATGGGEQADVSPGDLPLLLVVDAGSTAAEMREYVKKIFEFAQKEGASKEEEDFQGGKVTTLTNPDEESEGELEKIYFGELGTRFLVSINRPYLDATMAAMGGANSETIGKTADFQRTAQALGEDSDLIFYVNLGGLITSIRKNTQNNPMVAMFWGLIESKLIGSGMKSLGVSGLLKDDGIHENWFVNTGGVRDGLLALFDGPTFSPKDTGSIIPADVTYFSKSSVNIGAFYGLIKEVANMALSLTGNAGMDVEQFVELTYQIKLKEVIDSLGNQLIVYSRGDSPTSVPVDPVLSSLENMTIALELKNEEPVRKLITQIGILMGGGLQAEKYLERDLFRLDPSSGENSPALAISDKLLIFAIRQASVKELMRRQGKSVKGVSDDEAYQRLAALAPAQVIMVEYYSREGVKIMFEPLKMIQNEFPLPDTDIIADVISGAVSFGHWAEDGLHGKSVLKYRATGK